MNRNLFEYNEYIGYKFIPNLKSRVNNDHGGYLIRTNQQGFRNDVDFSESQPKDTKRMLVFGDSYTAGDGVSNGNRYTDYIQEHSEYDIYNFGLSGTGTDQQYLIYKNFTRGISADKYMLTILVENIRRVNSKYRFYMDGNERMICYPKPYYTYENGELELHHSPVPNETYDYAELSDSEKAKVDKGGRFYTARKVIKKLGMKGLAQKLVSIQPYPEFDSPNSSSWVLLKEILIKWCKEIDKPIYLVPLPTYHYIEDLADPAPYLARFNELAQELDVTLIDPLPYFRKYEMDERKKFRFEGDPHLTKLGHKRLGQFLSEQIN